MVRTGGWRLWSLVLRGEGGVRGNLLSRMI
jgi:hypothetical protein